MINTIFTASCQLVCGAAMGYIVFIDEGVVFDWPIWLWLMVAIAVVTFACNRILVHGESRFKTRAAATTLGAAAMVGAPIAYDWTGVFGKEPVAATLTVVFLLIVCNFCFLPAWIGALLPAQRIAGVRL